VTYEISSHSCYNLKEPLQLFKNQTTLVTQYGSDSIKQTAS